MYKTSIGALADAGALSFGDGYRTKRSEHGVPGYRILRVADVHDGRIELDGPDFVSEKHARAIGPKLSQADDVLLTTKGTVGRVAIYPDSAEKVVYSPQLCYFRVNSEGPLDARYLSYWFKSDAFKSQASHRANNTDMAAYLNLRDIATLHVDLPSLHEQRAIAEVLGALDDKIKANAKLIAVIDAQLSTRFAKLSAGHTTTALSSFAALNQRSTRPRSSGKLRYLDISSVKQGTYDFPPQSEWQDAPGRARRIISRGDVVWSTVRPTRRSHALVLDDEELVGSTGLAVLTPHPGRTATLYEAVRTDGFVAYLESVAEGSAYPAVRADCFLDAPVPALEPDEIDRFEVMALPLRLLVHAMTVESRQLAHTRDELLPLLMTGKIRIKEADKSVEGVA